MRETTIALMRARGLPFAYRGHRSRVSAVKACATCDGTRDGRKLDHHAGFCRDCLDRSRIVDDDDIGGES